MRLFRIYQLEKSISQSSAVAHNDAESSPLISTDDPDAVFRRALDQELEKICSFYQLKELEIYGEVGELMKDEHNYEEEADHLDIDHLDGAGDKGSKGRRGSMFGKFGFGGKQRRTSTMSASTIEEEEGDSDDDTDERTGLNMSGMSRDRRKTYDANAAQAQDDLRSSRELPSSKRRASQAYEDYNDQNFSTLVASGMTLKKRTISLYVSLCELKSFVQLNKTGFSKVLKKYDKTLNRNLKSAYVRDSVTPAYPFTQETMRHIDENIQNTERTYADVITKGDVATARRELRLHLREHVVWERNTVWREMIGIERKAQAANMGLGRTLLGGDHDPKLQGDEADELATKEVDTPIGKYRCPRWLFSSTFFTLMGIIIVFVVLLVVPIMKKPEQQNCLALLVFVSLLWATEVRSTSDEDGLDTHLRTGHTSVRHSSPCPILRSGLASGKRRSKATSSTRPQGCDEVRLCSYVDSSDYATVRRLHNRCSIVKIPHCQDDGYSSLEQGWNSTSDGSHY